MTFKSFEQYATAKGLNCRVTPEPQNSDYQSGITEIAGTTWHIRTARTTPTKKGAFVAFWTRDKAGKTTPFSTQNAQGGLLVFVEQGTHRGVFTFTAEHLERLGITAGCSAGKRGFRVYPSWCTDLNPQATAAQRAQAPAFSCY
ncbi:MepB family protein [Corynebacterium pseudotuberculosis]|uniref:Metallopeptidase n=1 Tax=Corynebacterium pseudotuberculosis (strain C231) TaxID=681645 RepID=D9QDI7_CORP2|nr:MepB family protein [Corynebacterium pseudotuberculosis]ADK27857.1 metallopeptidase [Corynebacterium pseudotuberculosis FRC41]ADL09560.1 metallopeptidase [Corynebacterium pseudotuberculosis C231]ADL19970.1 MepB family protein [Corynebacterium pseudotuberculosis 1002]ADO25357.1 metallopeptidase [Corynebacterium pseudotuberculosis I19]AEK91411.1 Metallopeptidase MepB [Corynebacterium pseudotuberculosis PAT10]